MNRTVFIPTIQHTGTWFCIELLANHSTNISGRFIHHKTLNKLLNEYTASRIIIDNRKKWESSLFGPQLNLIHAHFGDGDTKHSNDKEKFLPQNLIEDLVQMFPSLSSTRDPLLALLSRHARFPKLEHFYIINGFITLIELYRRYRIFVLPVDLYAERTNVERYNKLVSLMKYLGLEIEPYLAFWAINWPVHNPTNIPISSKYRNYYKSKKLKKIIALIPDEYEYLKNKESILKPFLQELGYENLLWWED